MMRRKKISAGLCVILSFIALFLALQQRAFAVEPVIVEPGITEVPLGPHLEILEDPEGKWVLSDVLEGGPSASFVKSGDDFPGFGFTRSVYWARFTVYNKSDRDVTWYLEASYPLMDRINVYRLDRKGRLVEERASGGILPFESREIGYTNFVFSFTERENKRHTYYVRFQTSGAMNLYLSMWSPEAFNAHAGRMDVVYAVYYGAMMVMIIYNLLLFFSLLDRSYLFYVLYCMAFVILQLCLNGLAFRYLWPSHPWWAKQSIPFWIMLALIFSIEFIRYFLETANYAPVINRVLKISSYVLAAMLPLIFIVDYLFVVIIAIIITMFFFIFLYIVSVRILMLGNRAARMYIITWAAFWIGALVYSLKMFSIMPDAFVTRWMLQIASLVQVILLSLALADKIKYMTEKMGVLNESLETKVQERTQELNSALLIMKKKEIEVQKEFHLAGDIQQGILPQTPFYNEGIKVVAYYKSMGPVGGDFYDIFQMKGGYVGIVVADASGHGMPAAFITALAKISFAEAIQTSLFPADIFRHVNNELIKAIKTDDFVTAFFVVISPTYDVFYSNASHQMAMVLRKDSLSIETWDTNGLFMGYSKDATGMYEDGQNKLNYGDRLLLYTDGITGTTNGNGASFGENRLERLLIETAELQLEEARDRIIRECREFAEGTQQTDDMTLVIIEIDPAYRELVEYREQGFKLMWRQRYHEAIGLLEKALAINEADEKSHLFLGECCMKNGDYSKAVLHLQRYLVNNEFDANVWYNLAWAYYCLDDYTDTLKYATRASSLKGNFIDALMLCALSMKKMGDLNGAKKMFEKILASDPDNEMAEKELKEIGNG
jgi:serine phosphatase RsbU (regulator of sigma subunit)